VTDHAEIVMKVIKVAKSYDSVQNFGRKGLPDA
jgi:hypothetical protein